MVWKVEIDMSQAEMKELQRNEVRARLSGIGTDELARKSAAAVVRLTEMEAFCNSGVVMVFLPMRGKVEIDARGVAERAWGAGKRVCVPRVIDYEAGEMEAILMEGLDDEMEADRYGVLSSVKGEIVDVGEVDMVVVPGIGFDEEGWRLGRGGGFYDRYLSRDGFCGISCGLGFEEQMVVSVARGEYDVSLDALVTDERTLVFKQSRER